jgi:hypothetical protein
MNDYNEGIRAAAALVLCGVVVGSVAGQTPIVKVATVEASSLRAIRIDANVADLRLTTTDKAIVRAEVVLDSRDASRLPECARAELRSSREHDDVRLTVRQVGRERCHERWTVEVPAGIALDVRVDVGSINADVRGRYGDIEARASVGRAELEIDGRTVIPGNEPGPSTTVRLKGDGPRLSLRSGTGSVRAVVSTHSSR